MNGSSQDVIIGNSVPLNRPFGGLIGLVRIYNRALSEEEIKHNMLHHLSPRTEGLALWIPFDEGSGTTVADKSGKGNDGTIYGAVWEKQALEDLSGYGNDGTHYGPVETRGRYLRALDFDGVDDYIDCGTAKSLDITETITIEAWVNPSAITGTHSVIDKRASYVLTVESDEKIRFFYSDGISWHNLASISTVSANKWTHLAATQEPDGSNTLVRIYIDGRLDNSGTITGRPISAAEALAIGRHPTSNVQQFDGLIDGAKVYNRVLSADEIKAHYRGARLLPQRTLTKLR